MNKTQTRRQFLKIIGAACAYSALPGCANPSQKKCSKQKCSKPRQPNIILCMADDVGFEAFNCYGGTSYKTPRIDQMAQEGLKFNYCYSQPVCTPSRIKIMTGQSNIRNYRAFSIMGKDEKTFGPMMQQAGYKTAVAGKWQLYGAPQYGRLAGTGMHPKDAGFDEYCLWQIDKQGDRYWKPLIKENGKVLATNSADDYGPDVFYEFIEKFIEENKQGPFFVYYPMVLVHSPFLPTPDSENKKEKDKQKNFTDMVAYMDEIMGKIVDKVHQLDIQRETLIIFTADNGTHPKIVSQMGDKAIQGGKASTHEYGIHVPMVAYWPGTTPKGKVCDDLVDFSDFMPTLAQAANAKLPTDVTLDGRSFLDQLKGKKGNPRQWYYCYYNPRPTRPKSKAARFARDHRWKLYGNGKFFDAQNDPLEKNPIEPQDMIPEAKAAHKKLLAALNSMPKHPQKTLKPKK
jgi:arylsulfatase A